jgi:integrase
VLPLTSGVVELLQELPRPIDGDTLLFRSFSDPHKPYEFHKHWNKAVKAAGLVNFRFHYLRHSCASCLTQNGATLLQIADVLGHKQLEVTKRYSQLCVDQKQDLVDRPCAGGSVNVDELRDCLQHAYASDESLSKWVLSVLMREVDLLLKGRESCFA